MALLVVSAALAAGNGCGSGLNGSGPETPGTPPPSGEAAVAQHVEGRGADFRLFDPEPTSGDAARRPRFWVHVDSFTLAEEKVYSFENAQAIIYGRDGQMGDMYLEAGGGSYQEAKSAYLKGGVVARIGEMRLDLSDFEWLNEAGEGRSDNPVSIVTPDSELKASSVRLYHKDKQFVLTDVTGTLRLERVQQ